jgi:hypothetical protein
MFGVELLVVTIQYKQKSYLWTNGLIKGSKANPPILSLIIRHIHN